MQNLSPMFCIITEESVEESGSKNRVRIGSDQAGYPIGAGLGLKKGRFSVLKQCFRRQKERFKQ